ncbi:hypothetical protein D8674_033334 [Pyrus ussuriensis x Pyrus communis]|uniref:Uncharacterized protein n=1 Tax=Pyrus ussuriensis x Pyrus communis TaxID=2448454 RepID=A0A5N5HKU7_9ROSA|nr:hypothetical protein D8674_033334 [Pyrus ussuriensis x Pyrus communis]
MELVSPISSSIQEWWKHKDHQAGTPKQRQHHRRIWRHMSLGWNRSHDPTLRSCRATTIASRHTTKSGGSQTVTTAKERAIQASNATIRLAVPSIDATTTSHVVPSVAPHLTPNGARVS